jgi:hypothetical protein
VDETTPHFIAPPGWEPDQPNPFSADGSYEGWSCFRLTEAHDDWIRNGCEPSGLYLISLGRRCVHVERRLGDFLRYETAQGRKAIVAGLSEQQVQQALTTTVEPTTVRCGDPRWMVHATSLEAWAAIRACGELRPFALLPEAGKRAIGELLLNDPPDYAQHVALGEIDKIGPEFVVACRQAGKMLPNPDVAYEPGARLYFDAHAIIHDGLAVRDGLHPLKVRDRLPLNPYLIAAITVADLPPLPEGQRWKTTLFLQQANVHFTKMLKDGEEP